MISTFRLLLLHSLYPPQLRYFPSLNSLGMTALLTAIETAPHHLSDDIHLLILLEVMGSSVLSRMHTHILMFIDDNPESYVGRYVFTSLSRRRRDFNLAVGETPESFLEMFYTVLPNLEPQVRDRQPGRLNRLNRLLLTLLWLKTYPLYNTLSIIFDISRPII